MIEILKFKNFLQEAMSNDKIRASLKQIRVAQKLRKPPKRKNPNMFTILGIAGGGLSLEILVDEIVWRLEDLNANVPHYVRDPRNYHIKEIRHSATESGSVNGDVEVKNNLTLEYLKGYNIMGLYFHDKNK